MKKIDKVITDTERKASQNKVPESNISKLYESNIKVGYHKNEIEKQAAELILANIEIAYQKNEKAKRAAELIIANIALAYENGEKIKRADELTVIIKNLAYQNEEKAKRAAELLVANKELLYQVEEKGKRAAELVIANKELAFQNKEKEKRATELRIANTKLKTAADVISKFNAELEEKVLVRTAQLEATNKQLQQFASIASHDLQEPLRMVSSFLGLLENKLEGMLDEKSKQYFEIAVDGATRMRGLIQDLLKFSSIGNKKQVFKSTDLNKTMQYVMLVLNDKIEQSRAQVTIKNLPTLMANKTLIGQVFLNLVSNALKYAAERIPEIEIGVLDEVDKWKFYVKDNSIGIQPEYLIKIFTIFERLHNKKEYSGTGIGLAICKKIVETHSGKIWAESEPGIGSTFYFTIPKN